MAFTSAALVRLGKLLSALFDSRECTTALALEGGFENLRTYLCRLAHYTFDSYELVDIVRTYRTYARLRIEVRETDRRRFEGDIGGDVEVSESVLGGTARLVRVEDEIVG